MASFKKKSSEKKVFLIGFTLILIAVLFTFGKPYFKKNQASESGINSQEKKLEYPKISVQDLENKIRNKENISIVDIRPSDYYGAEHIIDSISIPFENLQENNIHSDHTKLIIVLDEGADKSNEAQAVTIIKNKGFKEVKALEGGMASWKINYGQTVSWGNPNSFTDNSKVAFISPEELKKYMDEKSSLYILDTRSSSSFSGGHISGAVNIPINDLEMRRNEIPVAKIIAVYGETELQSFQAGVRLYDLGFPSVQVMQGGLSSWKNKKMEIVK